MTGMSIMRLKPISTDKDMWIYDTSDAVKFLEVLATYYGHL